MAVYNTSSDSANTAIRAFLTKIGEHYWGKSFNTSSGASRKVFEKIRDEVFEKKCAYCGNKSLKLQMEHLIMFNKIQYGLHHPGNVVPVCQSCNKRKKDKSNNYLNWEEHLEQICRENNDLDSYFNRRNKIRKHMNEGEYKYPELNEAEQHAIRVIANSLYNNIKLESDKALRIYQDLDDAFINRPR